MRVSKLRVVWCVGLVFIGLLFIVWSRHNADVDLFEPVRYDVVSDRSVLADLDTAGGKVVARAIVLRSLSAKDAADRLEKSLALVGFERDPLFNGGDQEFYDSHDVLRITVFDKHEKAVIWYLREPSKFDVVVGKVSSFKANPYLNADDEKLMQMEE